MVINIVLWTVCFFLVLENIILIFHFRSAIFRKISCVLNRNKDLDSSVRFIDGEDEWYINHSQGPILIMHGAGGTGHRYSNSKEGILSSIEKGYSIIEIDIGITSDNVLVLTHRFMPDDEICFESRPSFKEFLKRGAPYGETALSLKDFFDCFSNSSVFFILDCAHGLEENVAQWVKDNIAPDKRRNLIFQVHTQSLLLKIYKMKVFEHLHYNGSCRNIVESIYSLKECNIHTCSIADEELFSSNVDLLKIVNSGLHVFAYTINHKRRLESLISLGVDGAFTDTLTMEDVNDL